MTGLLSLPNEVLIQILSSSPKTRALCDLAHVNKRMRAIWLQHSEQIITDVYNSKMPYFQDAVDFTLAEARQAATITIDIASPEAQPLYRHLPQILRNVDLDVKLCDRYAKFRKSIRNENSWYSGRIASLHGAYFLIRRAVLGCTLPDMRPGLRAGFRSLPTIDVNTSYILLSYTSNFAPYNLRCEIDCVLTEQEMKDVPVDDQMTRPPPARRYADILIGLALREKEQDVTGMLEAVWTKPLLNEEDMEYSSDSDYPMDYMDSDEEYGLEAAIQVKDS